MASKKKSADKAAARDAEKAKKAKKAATKAKEKAKKDAAKAKERAKKDAAKTKKSAKKAAKNAPKFAPTELPVPSATPAADWTVTALRAAARDGGMTGYSRLTKSELLARLGVRTPGG